jgi:hypothetical protein
MRVRITRQDDAKSPGGRAKLRLSRGFPGCLACDVTPYEMSRLIDPGFMGVRITRQDDAKSPGSDGASPYLPALPRLSPYLPASFRHSVSSH